ncbi:MAG: hypothetical protein H6710_11260 [Myxococcales bacterium]|nr:hypothetical protein [Myxococcales bacterium]
MTALLPLPTLRVPLASRERPIELVELRVSAEISGALAVTTWELVFHNPNGRDLEGQLEFPLLDGHTVIRFAMDMRGELREAVPVPKDKGRQVFEEIVRRGVDPGLLERTAGNNYKARIYPLPARGRKRVVIAYQEALADATYRLPLAFDAPLPRFHLRLAVRGPQAAPVVTRDSLGLSLPAWRQDHVVEVSREGFRAQGVLEIGLPPGDRPAITTEERGGKVYFRAERAIDARTRPRPAPRVLGLLWDASGSGEGRDLPAELAALGAYLKALPGPLEVRLVRLRDVAEAAEVFKVEGGEWTALRRAIERTVPDGASSLAGVAADPAVDAWILVSDGLLNFGPQGDEAEAALLRGRAPVHVIAAAARVDHARLRAIADRSGGAHVDLLHLSPEAAVTELTQERERLLELAASPREATHLFPEAPAPLPVGGLVLAGVLRAQVATLLARVGFADDPASIRAIDLEIRADEERGALAGRAWAAAKIAALEPRFAQNRADIERTGQDFGIVTRQTSLIILDEVADYVRYDIAPPESLREACDRLRRGAWETRQRGEQERLGKLTRLFQDYCAWYDRIFDRDPPKPALPADNLSRAGRGRLRRGRRRLRRRERRRRLRGRR